jgi:hypothetical protein
MSDDLLAMFPSSLSDVIRRVADANSVPKAGLASGLLSLAAFYSHASYCVGPSGQSEPLQLFIANTGESGINKTGLTTILEFVVNEVNKSLVGLANDAGRCIEQGLHVETQNIPVLDRAASPAALIQKQSRS